MSGDVDELIGPLVDAMRYKLERNKRKGGWDSDSMRYFVRRLREEVSELENALIDHEAPVVVLHECADVANFAAMIARKAAAKG